MVLYYIVVFSFIYVLFYKTKRYLHMLQQNLYNENNRYLKWVWKNYEQFLDMDIIVVAISLIGYLIIFDLNKFTFMANIAIIILNIIVGYKWKKKIVNDQNKKPLS